MSRSAVGGADWQLARCERVVAYRAGARLGIVAEGIAPSACHVGRLRELGTDASPPRFAAEWRQRDVLCEVVETPVIIAGAFLLRSTVDVIEVAVEGALQSVCVDNTDDKTFDKRVGGD